ncbi:cell cycle checkpoint protein RAD17-like [Ptychodera flava]|uniref:cell cycle checkpoint protein RAD17-like n=1 Tax=Ptychodera flava TaxID=63121 RepID=UPI003969E816
MAAGLNSRRQAELPKKTTKGQATLLSLWSDSGDSNDSEDFDKTKKSRLTRSLTQPQPDSFERSKISHSQSKKKQQWISSSFDDFGDFGENITGSQPNSSSAFHPGSKKRQRETFQSDKLSHVRFAKPAKRELETEVWADKHKPKVQTDLAVHKKKISEVETWLQQHCAAGRQKKSAILLLTGPAGAGKTATMNVLCQEMGIEIQEWVNPLLPAFEASKTYQDFVPVGGFTSQSQQTLFHDFLLRANRYNTLQIFENSSGLSKKIILVEVSITFLYKTVNHVNPDTKRLNL